MRRVFVDWVLKTGAGLTTVLAVSLLTLQCSDPQGPEVVCTLIGCESGLWIELTGTFPDTFLLRVGPEDVGPVVEVGCTGASSCPNRFFIPGLVESSVRIDYTSGDQVESFTFQPDNQELFPNGEHCPPACIQGTIELRVDG